MKPFSDDVGSSVLLSLTDQDLDSESNKSLAKDITHALGSLPLALSQISRFIVYQCLALKDFLPLYERNAAKINAQKGGLSDYKHTLSTVWEMALNKLSGDASNLQKLLAFFDPDKIHEVVLTEGVEEEEDCNFRFLADKMKYVYVSLDSR